MIFKLAWRNIWRNRRRTFITAASILFAVMFASVMESLQRGAWNNMINNVVNFYYGYAQVHQRDYWEDKSLDLAMPLTDSLQALAANTEVVEAIVPRLESFGLASTGDQTFGVMVVGIDPEREQAFTGLADRLYEGAYLKSGDDGALLASGVADRLNLGVGDTVLLISQGYHGVNAAGKYPVRGLIDFPSPELDKQLLYLSLPTAQYFYGATGMVTTVALQIRNADALPRLKRTLSAELDTTYYAWHDWTEMMPELLEAKALDSAGNVIVYLLLYLIIAFGIFGTILMMTQERQYEFGILTSIGMRRGRLGSVIWLETVMLGIIGAVAGILVSIPIVYYLKRNPIQFSGAYATMLEQYGFEPIFPAQFDWSIFGTQALLVFIVTALLGLYPLWRISRLKPVEAMRA
jgi:putative ABC transport system permease protein